MNDDNDYNWHYQNFHVTTQQEKMDVIAIHQYLYTTSWAKGIDIETVRTAIKNSLCFGLFRENKQIGFARIVTDWATFGYLCDVYILDEWQGKKLGKWLMECCHNHPLISQLRRIMLVTSSAPWLYENIGYEPINRENFVWHIIQTDIYEKKK